MREVRYIDDETGEVVLCEEKQEKPKLEPIIIMMSPMTLFILVALSGLAAFVMYGVLAALLIPVL